MRIVSNTIVKNGMPFIGAILNQVAPYMNKMFVTISSKSTDETFNQVRRLIDFYPGKFRLDFENVKRPGELTSVRQQQLDESDADWILFLDDDDWWPQRSLDEMMLLLNDKNVDGYAINPFQLIDKEHHDASWSHKWFTKWFRKQPKVHYEHPWPRDLIYKGTELLYWKKNTRVPKIEPKFFHLSYLKDSSFRAEDWATKFKFKGKEPADIPPTWKTEVGEIWKYLDQK